MNVPWYALPQALILVGVVGVVVGIVRKSALKIIAGLVLIFIGFSNK